MIPRSSLLANRKQFLSLLQSWGIADSARPPGLANRRLSSEHCVNTLAVGRMCCVEPTAPQCKVSPPYIPRSGKYIHRMAPRCGGFTPFFSTPAVNEKNLIHIPISCCSFVWLALTSGMFVNLFSTSLQFGLGSDFSSGIPNCWYKNCSYSIWQ